jgi:NDP-sugar pyrophosphorylase family protein
MPVRAMILAAGLGTRMRPLSTLRPKPVLPVRGLPLVAWPLGWLARQGVTEAILNLHHLPDTIRAAARAWAPPGLAVRFSEEPELLGTGGGLRRAAAFLRESDPSVVIAGDAIFDLDLAPIVERHRARGHAATLVLRDDPRTARFGSVGIDDQERVRRMGRRFDLGGEVRAGLNVSVYLFSAGLLDTLPEREVFNHLFDWLAPRLAAGADDVRGVRLGPGDCVWEPVGTPAEYLAVNLGPPRVRYLDADARARALGVRLEPELVIGAGAHLGPGVCLRRAVVWDDETVPAGLEASDGVFAGGRFHPCREDGAAWGEAAT